MLIEEEELKPGNEVNPDVIDEGLLDDGVLEEEEVLLFREDDDEEADLLDIAFTDDDGHW